jgi:hypothetical protein
MTNDIYESVERLRARIVRKRLDKWWQLNHARLQMISVAWVSLVGEHSAPLAQTAGSLASNPTAAVVSARSVGRRGGIFECELEDLPREFESLRTSDIGSIQPVGDSATEIGMVFDRGPVHLNSSSLSWIEKRIFDEWVQELRAKREWVDVRDAIRVPVSRG